jgi:hypothetical protein
MTLEMSGPWSEADVTAFLATAKIPIRLAVIGTDGFPRVVSLWHRFEDRCFYCVTHRDSKLATLLQSNDKVGFEVSPNAPPYHGVRGQGRVSLSAQGGAETLKGHLNRYLGGTSSNLARWLLSRADDELLVTVEVLRLFSWDYRERMSDTG